MSFRILLIDDSALSRRIVRDVVEEIPGVSVAGEAANGLEGLEMMERLRPDLAILDVEMPVLDGIRVLEERKARRLETPVLMLSVLTREGADITFRALELGAIDFVPKPSAHMGFMVDQLEALLRQKISEFVTSKRSSPFSPVLQQTGPQRRLQDFDLVLMGSSTGGPQSLHRIFRRLPAGFPLPICIVQHMLPVFTASFAARLSSVSGIEVFEAEPDRELRPGQAIVARGGMHLAIRGSASRLWVDIDDSPPIQAHRPSIDFTVRSAREVLGARILGIIMTGMGRDGVDGFRELHDAGGYVIAQDEATSVIFGMNRRAIEEGIVDRVLSDTEIADYLLELQ